MWASVVQFKVYASATQSGVKADCKQLNKNTVIKKLKLVVVYMFSLLQTSNKKQYLISFALWRISKIKQYMQTHAVYHVNDARSSPKMQLRSGEEMKNP